MVDAAHPQHDDAAAEQDAAGEPMLDPAVWEQAVDKNPFPTSMTVPAVDGTDMVVDLAVLNGVVYAPNLDESRLSPQVRQYITQYCAAWSSSVLTVGKLEEQWPAPPRRAQVIFHESQLHAMLGLAADERLVRVVVDDGYNLVRFVVESPRLPCLQAWDSPAPIIRMPVSASYEQPATS